MISNKMEMPLDEKLTFLNYLKTSTHRDAIVTGLEIETGVVKHHGTVEISSEIQKLQNFLKPDSQSIKFMMSGWFLSSSSISLSFKAFSLFPAIFCVYTPL